MDTSRRHGLVAAVLPRLELIAAELQPLRVAPLVLVQLDRLFGKGRLAMNYFRGCGGRRATMTVVLESIPRSDRGWRLRFPARDDLTIRLYGDRTDLLQPTRSGR